MNAIDVKNLVKSFGELKAVQDISFNAAAGEVLSLLGPNGAGKSTTISMLSGLLSPDRGDAMIMGHSIKSSPAQAKAALGVVPQDIALYPDLTARENLDFWGKMYNLRGQLLKERVEEVLEVTGLTSRQKDKVGTFSGGMKRRVNIGAALLHRPAVVIMDEPTVGIDPQSRRHILDSVKQLNQGGMTVLYTTHYMEEAEELSHHVAIVDQGRVVAFGTCAELIKLVGEAARIELTLNGDAEQAAGRWQKIEGISHISSKDSHATVLTDDSNRILPRLFDAAANVGARITSVNIIEPNLETVFLHLTGRALRD